MIEIIKSKSKCFTVLDTIYGEPTPGTLADYIQLKDYYKTREDSHTENDWKITLFHHFNFLLKEKIKNYGLKCVYCGKDKLLIQPVGFYLPKDRVATVDHFYPKFAYKDRLDEDNMLVCCQSCNNKKSDKIYSFDKLLYISKKKLDIIKKLKLKENNSEKTCIL